MKIYYSSCALILMLLSRLFAQGGFYDLNTIQTIEITFTQPNWDYMLDTSKSGSEGYVMASQVIINGVAFDSVGVKYKGNSSYSANQVKNPFHIELDTYKEQDYQGYKDIKLGNGFKDPSFLREVLSYKVLRNYMPAPESNFANVYINNVLIGLYSNSESIGKRYVNSHFGSKSNTLIKCNPIGGAGPGTTNLPNLKYLGSDSSLYYSSYEMKSDHGWSDLLDLCDTLANHITAVDQVININQSLWMLAFDNILVNLDSYLGGFSQNYYLYRDDFGIFQPMVWDLNESFGSFAMTGTINLNNTTAKQQMTHLLHQNDTNWPLVKNLLSNPTYKRMYLAHMRTILTENFSNNSYYTDAQTLQSLISSSVSADLNKFYSYSNFISNLNSDVNYGMGSAPGLSNLMNGRSTYLSALADFTATQPAISAISVSNNQPAVGSTVNITAGITNASATGVMLAYRRADFAPFVYIAMADDGLHGDGAANDGVFGCTVPVNSSRTDYFLYAENTSAGIFSPLRAEMEYYSIVSQIAGLNDLVINEFMASNSSTVVDQDGDYDDWIEIYNRSSQAISLDSVFLSDSYNNPQKWKFPANTVIAPNSYLIIWADDDSLQLGLHANYKLSASGERIILSGESGFVIDSISFGVQTTDISMQRCPNGSGAFVLASPSPGLSNYCNTSVAEEKPPLNSSVYPNPFSGKLHIDAGGEMIKAVRIINMTGRDMYTWKGDSDYDLELDLSDLPNGLYVIILNDSSTHKIIKI